MTSIPQEPVADPCTVDEIVAGLKRAKNATEWSHLGARYILGSDSSLALAFRTLRELRLRTTQEDVSSEDVATRTERQPRILHQLKSLLAGVDLATALSGWLKPLADEDLPVATSQATRTWELMRMFVDVLTNPWSDGGGMLTASVSDRDTVDQQIRPDLRREWLDQSGLDRAEWWALYDELVAQQPPTLDKDEAYQAELPVLFVRDEFSQAKGMIQVGRVGLLSISRKSEGPILYPELGAMGLTTLSVGEDDGFLDSIQRVWDISKLASTDSHRYSWRIVRHPQAKPDSLALPRFHNRSCEAAFLCTLWAASGGIPGDDEDKRMGVDSLDIRSTVTAKLGRLPVSGKLRDIPLEGVHGLPEKAQAAADAGIDTIIVANGHDPEELKRIPKELLERIAIIPLKTMGEVFDQLVSMSRYTRRFREACSVYFRSQFQPVDDDGNPVGGEQGADGGGQRAG